MRLTIVTADTIRAGESSLRADVGIQEAPSHVAFDSTWRKTFEINAPIISTSTRFYMRHIFEVAPNDWHETSMFHGAITGEYVLVKTGHLVDHNQ